MTARRAAWTACLLTLALLAAACGGDDDSGDETAGSTTTEQSDASETTGTTGTTAPATTTTTQVAGADDTTQGAIARAEQFLHALGEGDIATICEIAGPAAQRAEAEGAGSCETAFGLMVTSMISPEQREALATATVDPNLVDETTPGQVEVPVDAIVSSVTFTEQELGSLTLAYQNDNWFIID
jgi:hypothetical protein